MSESYDWVDCSLFLMFAHAHMTDWDLADEELQVIKEKTDIFVSAQAGEGQMYTTLDVDNKMKKAFDWYNDAQSGTDEELVSKVAEVATFLKNQEWFNPTFAQSMIDFLAEISEADGVINDNEKGNLDNLAQHWGVTSPIS